MTGGRIDLLTKTAVSNFLDISLLGQNPELMGCAVTVASSQRFIVVVFQRLTWDDKNAALFVAFPRHGED